MLLRSMISQVGLQNLLISKLTELQKKNPKYSLRAFADKLDIGAGPLSQILKGKRRVSEKLASQLLDRIDADLDTRSKILIKQEMLVTPTAINDDAHILSEDQNRLIADWYHYAILSLTLVKDFKNQSNWIAERLGISENQVQDAIARMKRLRVLEESSQRKLKPTHRRVKTTDDVPNEYIKKGHEQTLELARRSLNLHTTEERDFTHLTVPTNPERIRAAKLHLRRMQAELCDILMDTTDRTEVYRLSIGLFPLTTLKLRTGDKS